VKGGGGVRRKGIIRHLATQARPQGPPEDAHEPLLPAPVAIIKGVARDALDEHRGKDDLPGGAVHAPLELHEQRLEAAVPLRARVLQKEGIHLAVGQGDVHGAPDPAKGQAPPGPGQERDFRIGKAIGEAPPVRIENHLDRAPHPLHRPGGGIRDFYLTGII